MNATYANRLRGLATVGDGDCRDCRADRLWRFRRGVCDHDLGAAQGSETVELEPDEFTTTIDNPYFPMSPGSRWVYRETDTTGNRAARRRRSDERDEDDRQRG